MASRLIDGRHLGCGGSRCFFAEARVRRPSVGSQARPESPSDPAAVPRQEVSERIGLGRSSWPVNPRLALAAPSPRDIGVARSRASSRGRTRRLPPAVELEAKASFQRRSGASRSTSLVPGASRGPGESSGSRRRKPAGRVERASARPGMLDDAGIGRFRGRARGVFGLQTSARQLVEGRRPRSGEAVRF